jgi:dTDP-4-amino-4,6-dideoxygalactose transaminase
MWSDILERVDKCSNNLQSETLNLEAGIKQLKTLEEFLNAKRNEFDVYEQSAISIAGCGSPSYTQVRKRKVFADETHGAGD